MEALYSTGSELHPLAEQVAAVLERAGAEEQWLLVESQAEAETQE